MNKMRILVCVLLAASVGLPQIKMPPFERIVMENGVVLVLMPKRDLPLLSISVAVKGGTEADPTGLQGLASVTAEMLTLGTASRSREKLAQDLDQLGVVVQRGVGRQSSRLNLECMTKDRDQALGILEDMLLHSSFAEAELKRLIAQGIDAVRVSKDRPGAAMREYAPAFYFGKTHPYGRAGNGDELSLAKITSARVKEFWTANYVGRNMVVVVGGDFDPVAMRERMKAMLGGIPAGVAHIWKQVPLVDRGAAPRLLLVDLPEATQTYFTIAQPGIERSNSDRTPLELVNTLFGGRFTSMLNEALRVDSGLSYGASSEVQIDRLPGAITISTFTKTATTVEAIDLALKQLDKLNGQGIDSEQLASAKVYVKGEFPTAHLETVDQLTTVLTDIEVYGLNRGEVDDFISRIDSVNLEKANATAHKYYQSKGVVFVLIGDAAKIRGKIGKYAKDVTEVKISAPGY